MTVDLNGCGKARLALRRRSRWLLLVYATSEAQGALRVRSQYGLRSQRQEISPVKQTRERNSVIAESASIAKSLRRARRPARRAAEVPILRRLLLGPQRHRFSGSCCVASRGKAIFQSYRRRFFAFTPMTVVVPVIPEHGKKRAQIARLGDRDCWRSLGDSNPCFRRERATSWAARRREPRFANLGQTK